MYFFLLNKFKKCTILINLITSKIFTLDEPKKTYRLKNPSNHLNITMPCNSRWLCNSRWCTSRWCTCPINSKFSEATILLVNNSLQLILSKRSKLKSLNSMIIINNRIKIIKEKIINTITTNIINYLIKTIITKRITSLKIKT